MGTGETMVIGMTGNTRFPRSIEKVVRIDSVPFIRSEAVPFID
jgi:hypothetical protein